jgi:hypothetical protein
LPLLRSETITEQDISGIEEPTTLEAETSEEEGLLHRSIVGEPSEQHPTITRDDETLRRTPHKKTPETSKTSDTESIESRNNEQEPAITIETMVAPRTEGASDSMHADKDTTKKMNMPKPFNGK